ncbi:MAG: ketoacyl-ACP synthase III [Deltaproteobacteria bacterium]|nr:ketoacyl-ACP synthase III [Deltaproteobacteria bacterium]MBW1927843.1 ketoacyl-ACP synthase III [Deltaproteobacteria bacterium]MBW2026220.1 ketoacyl-ACP synthase III [Deltaproteobacteria bacterium]MBW2125229.1 ketoacyl-ACP synthase III [Deltaproteobacteria bacterium]RLB20879.1 MAG: ketoacyl-ACP synthase III [Deltaproteobacteria bacterium]
MKAVRILGTGSYVPPKVLTNFDLKKMGLDTTDEWIVQRTGVRERRVAEPDVATSDLAYEASLKALEMAGLTAKDMDLIIVATITPDTCCPSAANWLQAKLDAPQAITFDVTAACSGFIFGLNVAEQYLKAGTCRLILVAASEVMTRTLNWKDRTTCILWGDGAGAAIVTMGDEGPELLSTHVHTDGKNGQDLLLPGGGSKTTPISHESVDKGLHTLNMIEANASFRVAVRHFIESIKEACDANGVAVQDVDWFIPHQANLRMFQSMAKTLKIPIEKFYVTLDRYGNISSASCAIALDEAVRDGSIKPGHLICMPVFGGGLTWGSALIKWA